MITNIITARKQGRPPKNVPPKAYEKITTKKRIPTRRVYICSPLKGNIERNMARAKIYCRFAFEKGYVAIAPHLYYPQFLDDTNKDERAAGMRYGLDAMWQARQLWVFGKIISDGMRAEIELAEELKIPVRFFDSDMEEIT